MRTAWLAGWLMQGCSALWSNWSRLWSWQLDYDSNDGFCQAYFYVTGPWPDLLFKPGPCDLERNVDRLKYFSESVAKADASYNMTKKLLMHLGFSLHQTSVSYNFEILWAASYSIRHISIAPMLDGQLALTLLGIHPQSLKDQFLSMWRFCHKWQCDLCLGQSWRFILAVRWCCMRWSDRHTRGTSICWVSCVWFGWGQGRNSEIVPGSLIS